MRSLLIAALFLIAACSGPSPVPNPTTVSTATPLPNPSALPSDVVDVCHPAGQVLCALDPRVTPDNIRSTICNGTWSGQVRPFLATTNTWKILDLKDLPRPIQSNGQPIGSISQAEGDHRMPIGLGGDPGAFLEGGTWVETSAVATINGDRLPFNFTLEYPPSPNPPDALENSLHNQVCFHGMPLVQAREQIVARKLAPFPAYK